MTAAGPQGPAATTRRAAILMIHGIGQQSPYETLDAFTRGLAANQKISAGNLQHILKRRGKRAETTIRMTLNAPLGRESVTSIDLCEFYWADLVQGQISFGQVVGWLARTSLTPLRSLSRGPKDLVTGKSGRARLGFFVAREILRAVLLLAVVGVLLAMIAYAIGAREGLTKVANDAVRAISLTAHPVQTSLWCLILIVGLALVRGWAAQILRLLRKSHLSEGAAERRWRRWSLVWFAILFVALALWNIHGGLHGWRVLRGMFAAVDQPASRAVMGAGIFLLFVRSILVKYIGDIALYVTADEKSSFFRTRTAILDEATTRLQEILDDTDYQAVYVMGHSLGSVIAYDTIGRLVRNLQVGTGPAVAPGGLEKLRGLVTFGSPLDKVHYFFRTQVDEEQAVRAQVLSSLHGFRRVSSGRDYGPFKFAPSATPSLPKFRWLNVHCFLDPVSGHLNHYDVETQVPRWYFVPLAAHTRYWKDSGFYDQVVKFL